MFHIVLLLMIVIPAVEIVVLLAVGKLVGGWMTFLLILLTGIAGAYLARKEATKVIHYAKYEWSAGSIPGIAIVDGICIFVGGVLLILPGFVTDLVGFLLVIPVTRLIFRKWVIAMMHKWFSSGRFMFFMRK